MSEQDERDQARRELEATTKNYRIAFDYAAEDPIHAIIYLMGVIEENNPEIRAIKFHWTVTDRDTGEVYELDLSLDELDAIAKGEIENWMERMKPNKKD